MTRDSQDIVMKTDEPQVLIVDDEPSILTMLSSFLARKGVKSLTCNNPTEALDILRSQSIKLVLLDINMPEINGLELLKKIIELVPSVHVIMITGYKDIEVAEQCMTLGAKDYITKPFEFKYLETSVFAEIIP